MDPGYVTCILDPVLCFCIIMLLAVRHGKRDWAVRYAICRVVLFMSLPHIVADTLVCGSKAAFYRSCECVDIIVRKQGGCFHTPHGLLAWRLQCVRAVSVGILQSMKGIIRL